MPENILGLDKPVRFNLGDYVIVDTVPRPLPTDEDDSRGLGIRDRLVGHVGIVVSIDYSAQYNEHGGGVAAIKFPSTWGGCNRHTIEVSSLRLVSRPESPRLVGSALWKDS